MKRVFKELNANARNTYTIIKRIRDRKRFAILSFEDDGIRCKRMYYDADTRRAQELKGFFLKGITEKNIRKHKTLQAFLSVLYFPFPYKISVLVPHHLGGSFYHTLTLERAQDDKPISQEELDLFFSQHLGKSIEFYKKEIMRRTGCDDLDALLVSNRVTSVLIDSQFISTREYPDAPLSMTGKKISFGIVQTFFHRPVFSALQRLLPKRAKLHSFFQDGFTIPLSIVQYALKTSTKKSPIKPFATALIRDTGTDIFACSGESISYHDSIPIGYHSMYETLNGKLGIDSESFSQLLHQVSFGDASAHVVKQVNAILSQEIRHMYNGLQAAKKETRSTGMIIDPGKMGHYIGAHTPMKRALISKESVLFFDDISIHALHDSLRMTTVMGCILRLPRKHIINEIAVKHIRWLIPHAIERV